MKPHPFEWLSIPLLGAWAMFATAGEADVVDAQVRELGDGRIQISATIRHDDTGWAHYADRFEVVDPDGNVVATRVLAHPHVEEQPFTRATRPFLPPDAVDRLSIRAHDSLHGYGGQAFELEFERD